jgi:hypothetical protein
MKLFAFALGTGVAAAAMAGGVDGSGLVVLDRSADGALSMTGNSVVEIPARAVYVNSSSRNAVRTTGTATLDCPNLYVVGGTSFSGRSGCTGTITQTGVPYQDPLFGLRFPSASGVTDFHSRSISGGGAVTLGPGYYSGGISISGNSNVTLSPGVYIIGGSGFRLTSGSVTGANVCLVMQGGSLSLAGNSPVTLTPPATGDLRDVVVAQPSTNTSAMSLSGGSALNISGTIYAPGATVSLTGNSSVEGQGPQMGDVVIANRVSLTGTATIKIGRADMRAIAPPQMPLAD